jgi:hypothetical protein
LTDFYFFFFFWLSYCLEHSRGILAARERLGKKRKQPYSVLMESLKDYKKIKVGNSVAQFCSRFSGRIGQKQSALWLNIQFLSVSKICMKHKKESSASLPSRGERKGNFKLGRPAPVWQIQVKKFRHLAILVGPGKN